MPGNRNSRESRYSCQLQPAGDDGCEVADTCLRCPLPECKWEDHRHYLAMRRLARDCRIVDQMQRNGISNGKMAVIVGVSLRSIYRAKQRVKAAPAAHIQYAQILNRAMEDKPGKC